MICLLIHKGFIMTKQLLSLCPSVWLAEGQSSQRDMLESLQNLRKKVALNLDIYSDLDVVSNPAQDGLVEESVLDAAFRILASHRFHRPEILEMADKSFTEPHITKGATSAQPSLVADTDGTQIMPRWQFVLEQAIEHQTKVLLTGRNSIDYELHRTQFEQAGIRLLTGSTSTDMLNKIDDKFAFIKHCEASNIPVAKGWRFDSLHELKALLEEHGHQPLCVKPVTGIFAQGFWRLDTGKRSDECYDSFEHLYLTDDRKITTAQFISAYEHSLMVKEKPIPMLLMPYLNGREYSIDVVCEKGEVLAAITRYKVGKVQHIGYDKEVMEVVIPLIRAFDCDGIVSVQTKEDSEGQHCVLEINSRPSGGIGYTNHSGVDLTQIGFAYWLGIIDKPNALTVANHITPCQVRAIMTSVKIA